MITFFKNIFVGILIGCGAILPGISSGVILVSFGLYEKMLNSVLDFFKNKKENFSLLFPIILGTILGVILFGNILKMLFLIYPNLSKFCFIGLILGTIPSIFKTAHKNIKYFELKNIFLALISFTITIIMIIFENNMTNSLVTTSHVNYFYLILSGFLMSVGVVIPRHK